jgi:hypothetical protein
VQIVGDGARRGAYLSGYLNTEGADWCFLTDRLVAFSYMRRVLPYREAPTRLDPESADAVYSALLTLESALIDLRRDYALLTETSQRNDPAAGAPALARICATVKVLASAYVTLKRHTVEDDRVAGRGPILSIGDLALRATKLLVASLLSQLQEVIARSPDKARRLFGDQLRQIEEVSALVLDGFEGASRLWNPPPRDATTVEPHDVEHHRLLRAVRPDLAAMANAPELCRVLQAGIKSLDWPALGQVCVQLYAVLRLDMEAAPSSPVPFFDVAVSSAS